MTSSVTKRIRHVTRALARLPTLLLLLLVRVYQKTLSPALPVIFGPACGCRFYPTCSHYAADALRTHGALRGTWLTLVRLLKCTPLHPGGLDPVPPPRRKPSCIRVANPAKLSRLPSHSLQKTQLFPDYS